MGKRIIQQARGKGSLTYRVRKKAFKYKIAYPRIQEGKAMIVKLLNSTGHTAPLAKLEINKKTFFIPAFKGAYEGKEVFFGGKVDEGNILKLGDIPIGTSIFNIESRPFDGGRFIRSAGSSAVVSKKLKDKVSVSFPSKKERIFNVACRATIGIVAGHGRLEKPFVKAGKKYYLMKSKNKLWPRTSAVKVNAIDHPFGSGRGKNPKSKIAKRNAPPGKKVGLLRPRRTGRKKR